MPAETVTLDRQAALDLLSEVYKVADVLEAISGTCPTRLTKALTDRASIVGEAVLGPTQDGPDGVSVGPLVDLWNENGAREFFRGLAGVASEGGCNDAR